MEAAIPPTTKVVGFLAGILMKELLISLNSHDFKWDFYRGSGKGGQHRNKTDSACRCTHIASGAVATAEDERSQHQNKRLAFKRMANTKKFQNWLKHECAKKMGLLASVNEKVNRELLNTRIEVKNEEGRWVDATELAITRFDIELSGKEE